ncbi:hypothetical protein GLYMA_02G164164v4 [Glycine max]|nr:hypothetical protein GLYMA_02G164164v4 [Glycine max]KAH1115772.1 hypothetical protein GYH30_057040 [Glycine max]
MPMKVAMDTMVEIQKNRREESLQKKRCEGLQSQQILSSLHSTVIEKKINSYHLSVIYLTQLLLSQSAQNPNVLICTPNFTIGSSRSCNFVLKDQTISANLCKIKHTQVLSRCGVECEGLETLCIKD